jgi:colanic acid/amylovoran biosynthesis glycosyltransferase
MKDTVQEHSIVMRVGNFPKTSETFIVQHACIILELDFKLYILVNKKNKLDRSNQNDLIDRFDLLNSIVELDNYWTKKGWDRIVFVLKNMFHNRNIFFKLVNPIRFGLHAIFGGNFLDYLDLSKVGNPSIIHVQFGYSITSIDKMKSLGLIKSKLIVTFHGADVHFNEKTKDKQRNYYKLLFSCADYFTCNTEYLAHQLIELGCPSEKLEVVNVPVDIDKFKPSTEVIINEKFTILSVGRLVKWKGHHNGIRSVKILIDKGYDVLYYIIGEGSERLRLSELTKELGVENHIIFLGEMSQNEVLMAMQQCDVFLMTSTYDSSGRKEAQGVVTIEAQACGKPVVAFNCGGVPYTVLDGRTGFLCEENNYSEMAHKLEELFINDRLRTNMGSCAVEFVREKFSKEVAKRKWKLIYNKLIDELNNEKLFKPERLKF